MALIKIYGIPNCDTVKKALVLLRNMNIPFEFTDIKKSGISKEKLTEWLRFQPLERLLNKKSTAWKMLSPEMQADATTRTGAVRLMQEYPNLIKRPVAEISGTILIGFIEADYRRALKQYT